ncbi:MAG TPA: PAS domain-containing protein, partial [Terriglobales bacterium]|nr:PAS domain-containing protein [Terriglobales bacterium]
IIVGIPTRANLQPSSGTTLLNSITLATKIGAVALTGMAKSSMGRCSTSDEKFVVGLADFFSNSNVGLAVFDKELRYQAVNPWLANVHRYPVDFHLGKTVRAILGAVADGAEPAIRRVFATGCTISNLEVGGKLPTKTVTERWVDNFFPIKDHRGEVRQVGGVIVPVPAVTIAGFMILKWHFGVFISSVSRWRRAVTI